MYDILIVSAPKDYNKLLFVYNSIVQNLKGYREIHIISPTEIKNKIYGIHYHLDREVFDDSELPYEGYIRIRRNWYKQQFIKLFQNVTQDEYLVIDSDTFLLKPLDVFENGKPVFFLGKDQYHDPYFEYIKRMFGFDRAHPHSFINEIMLFSRPLIKEMIRGTQLSSFGFLMKTVHILNDINHHTSSFSEYETYGHWVMKNYPEIYRIVQLKTKSIGRHSIWTNEEMSKTISDFLKTDYHQLSLHSWL